MSRHRALSRPYELLRLLQQERSINWNNNATSSTKGNAFATYKSQYRIFNSLLPICSGFASSRLTILTVPLKSTPTEVKDFPFLDPVQSTGHSAVK